MPFSGDIIRGGTEWYRLFVFSGEMLISKNHNRNS